MSLAQLQRTLSDALPTILEFWSEQCGFCGIMNPVYELLAKQYQGRAHFLTVLPPVLLSLLMQLLALT